MAVGISRPIRKGDEGSKNGLGTIGTIVGGIGGAFAGNPAAGAAIGGQVGGIAEGLTSKPPTPTTEGGGVEAGAIGRRIQQLETDNFDQLRQSLEALPQAPEEVRQAYAQPLLTAFTMEAKRRMGGGSNSQA